MFPFQNLEVYKKAKLFHIYCRTLVKGRTIDGYAKDQLSRASFSVPLNIAEGCGKFSKADRRNYYVTARSSVMECIAATDVLCDLKEISQEEFAKVYAYGDELSRMLFSMIKNLS